MECIDDMGLDESKRESESVLDEMWGKTLNEGRNTRDTTPRESGSEITRISKNSLLKIIYHNKPKRGYLGWSKEDNNSRRKFKKDLIMNLLNFECLERKFRYNHFKEVEESTRIGETYQVDKLPISNQYIPTRRYDLREQWNPNMLPMHKVDDYLRCISELLSSPSCMDEEMALKHLAASQYNVLKAITLLKPPKRKFVFKSTKYEYGKWKKYTKNNHRKW